MVQTELQWENDYSGDNRDYDGDDQHKTGDVREGSLKKKPPIFGPVSQQGGEGGLTESQPP